jgi:hypothetical protein
LQQHFEIHLSAMQPGLTLGRHGLIAVAIAVYVEPVAMMLGGLTLVGLLALRETRQLIRQEIISLKLNPGETSIELVQDGQPYFYSKYKVYATRWFAILKLIDKRKTRTLILNPDRCDSIQSYRRLRYALQQMDQADAA